MEFLDYKSEQELDFPKIWAQIKPKSSLGKGYKQNFKPYLPGSETDLRQEWSNLELVVKVLADDQLALNKLSYLLSNLKDLALFFEKKETLTDPEFYELKRFCLILREIQSELENKSLTPLLNNSLEIPLKTEELLNKGQTSQTSFYLANAYSLELKEIRLKRIALEEKLVKLQAANQDKVAALTTRVLSQSQEIVVSVKETDLLEKLKKLDNLKLKEETSDYLKFQLQTSIESLSIEKELQHIRSKEEELKSVVRKELTEVILSEKALFLENFKKLGYLDFLLAKAQLCFKYQGVKPVLKQGKELVIKKGRELNLEEELLGEGLNYTPLDLKLTQGVTLITGANMGGKTSCLKTIGLIIAMAQYGLLVPCKSLEFSLKEFIRVELKTTKISSGLSSFASEIEFIKDSLSRSEQRGLILIDEINHGTNPKEGAALAKAILEELRTKASFTVVTTHYPSLTNLEGILQLKVRGLSEKNLGSVRLNSKKALQNLMDYSLEEIKAGSTLPQEATKVAYALGLDGKIIKRAKELIAKGEEGFNG